MSPKWVLDWWVTWELPLKCAELQLHTTYNIRSDNSKVQLCCHFLSQCLTGVNLLMLFVQPITMGTFMKEVRKRIQSGDPYAKNLIVFDISLDGKLIVQWMFVWIYDE